MRKYSVVPDANSMANAMVASDWVDSRVLSANVAKSFTVPATARFVRLAAGQLFYFNPNGPAAVAASDISTGAGSVSVPATDNPFFCVDGLTAISVIAPTGVIISAEWFA